MHYNSQQNCRMQNNVFSTAHQLNEHNELGTRRQLREQKLHSQLLDALHEATAPELVSSYNHVTKTSVTFKVLYIINNSLAYISNLVAEPDHRYKHYGT